jgi:Zn-dependent protease with chaperone function
MKFIPKTPDSAVNVTQQNSFVEMLKLLFIVMIIGFLFYVAVGKSLDFVVASISPQQEKKLSEMMHFSADMGEEKKDAYLQKITDKLSACAHLPFVVETYLLETKERNAFALPGGKIYITRGMLKEIQNENELRVIIGHELGHFKHKDHLKGFGNALVLAFLSLVLDEKYGFFFESSLKLSQAKYSQKAEYDADIYGLELVACAYADVSSATTLFSRMNDGKKWIYFLETHPDFGSRIKKMKHEIQSRVYHDSTQVKALEKVY